jgi:phosphoglycerate dehydrogenase-like enzyme
VSHEKPLVAIPGDLNGELRQVVQDVLGAEARLAFLHGAAAGERRRALSEAAVLLTWRPHVELSEAELQLLKGARLIQCVAAGIDFVPFDKLPAGVPFAGNAGAYSKPMAEHVLAMTLAAAKGLFDRHAKLKAGVFEQFNQTRSLDGAVCGIVGFGGIGRETALLFRAMGARIHAVNRSGQTSEPVDFIGTLKEFDRVLKESDVLVLTIALNRATQGLIDARALGLTKKDAILVNVARGRLIDQRALYEHLVREPRFTACLDAWWVEPFVHGEFRLDFPFFELPNLIGSPHNSAVVPGAIAHAMRQAALNIRRCLAGETPHHLVTEADRL